MINERALILESCQAIVCGALLLAQIAGASEVPVATQSPSSWLMFHHDESHTGVATGRGNIDPTTGPVVHWTYRVTAKPETSDFCSYRWYSSFPLGDLDGDGGLEVIVTTPDNAPDAADRIVALKDMGGQSHGVSELWTYNVPPPSHGASAGVDQYSAALADADSDGLLDVLFCSKDGAVRALRGTDGQLIWEYKTGRFIEAGPMIADLDGDGALEAIVPTDCKLGASDCPGSSGSGALYVFRVSPGAGKKSNPPIWWRSFPAKLDSAEPAVADLDAGDGRNIKALIMGSWAGRLYVVWRNPDGKVYIRSVTLDKLDPSIHSIDKAVVRSSPLVWKFVGGVWSAVFGWMPDNGNGREGRISAVDISANMKTGAVTFTPKWTVSRADWKSSVSLLPVADPPLVVTGYGIGLPAGWGTGNYGLCCKPNLGGVLAIDASGGVVWERAFEKDGNIRGSTAVGDVDGDGRLEVILTGGCTGKLYAFDGATGAQEWSRQLGPRTIGTPSIGDLDGDGTTEIVICSYDGRVYALGGAPEGQTAGEPHVREQTAGSPSDGTCECE